MSAIISGIVTVTLLIILSIITPFFFEVQVRLLVVEVHGLRTRGNAAGASGLTIRERRAMLLGNPTADKGLLFWCSDGTTCVPRPCQALTAGVPPAGAARLGMEDSPTRHSHGGCSRLQGRVHAVRHRHQR